MKKILRAVGLVLLALLVIIQFIRPEKNVATAPAAFAADISTVYHVPAAVDAILKTSCYDCHSNNTSYPWYANFQPVAWWLNDHVVEGKKEVNFSEFAKYAPRRQFRKLEEVIEMVEEDEMPLASYTLIHRDASLTAAQKSSLSAWATAIRDTMKATYHPDSLVRKK